MGEAGTGLGNTPFPGTTIYPETHDLGYPNKLMIRGWCTGVPTDTTASRYAIGSELVQTDASFPTIWKNVGTVSSPVWGQTQGMGVAHAVYNFANDGGTAGTITPKITAAIPANAIVVGGTINSTTACSVSSGSASVSIGVSAGLTPATSKLLGVTPITSFTADALVNGALTFASPAKMTAAGNITYTITGNTLIAGVIETFVYYVVALNS